jgi:hypothetical protein
MVVGHPAVADRKSPSGRRRRGDLGRRGWGSGDAFVGRRAVCPTTAHPSGHGSAHRTWVRTWRHRPAKEMRVARPSGVSVRIPGGSPGQTLRPCQGWAPHPNGYRLATPPGRGQGAPRPSGVSARPRHRPGAPTEEVRTRDLAARHLNRRKRSLAVLSARQHPLDEADKHHRNTQNGDQSPEGVILRSRHQHGSDDRERCRQQHDNLRSA